MSRIQYTEGRRGLRDESSDDVREMFQDGKLERDRDGPQRAGVDLSHCDCQSSWIASMLSLHE